MRSIHVVKVLLVSTIALVLAGGLHPSPEGASAEPPVDNLPPVAVASVREGTDDLWENMTLHFSSDGSHDDEDHMVTVWDFGDGSEETTEPNPVHVYTMYGPVTVVLTVIDQHGVTDSDHLDLYIWRDYGYTDIIIKAQDYNSERTFKDPGFSLMPRVAVKRDGWVAYLCQMNEGHRMEVAINVVGDRPADVFLFREDDFTTYKNEPGANQVPFEAEGTFHNVTGEVGYTYTIPKDGRYYVVVDNRDQPAGTDTRGPVDYRVEITPHPPVRDDPETPWEYICLVGFFILVVFVWLVYHFGRPEEPRSPDL